MLSLGSFKFHTPILNVGNKVFKKILLRVESHRPTELKKPEIRESLLDDSIQMRFKYRRNQRQ